MNVKPNDDDYVVALTILRTMAPSGPDANEIAQLIAAYRVACAEEAERKRT